MVALRAGNAIRDATPETSMRLVARVALLGREGRVLFESDLG